MEHLRTQYHDWNRPYEGHHHLHRLHHLYPEVGHHHYPYYPEPHFYPEPHCYPDYRYDNCDRYHEDYRGEGHDFHGQDHHVDFHS